jgi:hypothetical protein
LEERRLTLLNLLRRLILNAEREIDVSTTERESEMYMMMIMELLLLHALVTKKKFESKF